MRLARALERTTRDWTVLGRADPLWAVYVTPGTRHGQWDVDEFFETGRAEVDDVLDTLAGSNITFGRSRALDFGCGVGRLSQALSRHFQSVAGIDVSAPMLETARSLASSRHADNIEFVLNQRPDLRRFEDSTFDLIYSSLVLQHLPKSLAAAYLREFVRVVRSDGAVIIQVASQPTRSLRGQAFRWLPPQVSAWIQVRILGYPAPMRMSAMSERWVRAQAAKSGAMVVFSAPDTSYGGHWTCIRLVLRKLT